MFQIVANLITLIIFSYTFKLEPCKYESEFQRYGHSKLYKTADGRDLGFGPTENSAIRSADLKNLSRTKHELDRLQRYGRSKFSKMRGRSVVGPPYIHCSHVLLFATLGT